MAYTTTERPSEGLQVGYWFWFLTLATAPRVFILAFWIFGSTIGDAYSSWVIPALGFVVLPNTTLAYALMWGIDSNAVSGFEWLAVALAFLLDIWMYGAWQRLRMVRHT